LVSKPFALIFPFIILTYPTVVPEGIQLLPLPEFKRNFTIKLQNIFIKAILYLISADVASNKYG
jgi:hypothetical protein